MLKALKGFVLAALFSACLVAPTPAAALSNLKSHPARIPDVQADAIRRVHCTGGWGTGFAISKDTVVTAYHVVSHPGDCKDDATGDVFKTVWYDAHADIAVLKFSTTTASHWLHIDCTGYLSEQTYYSFGYAGLGDADLMMTRMYALGTYTDGPTSDGGNYWHMSDLLGVIIPGMSGGPILNGDGEVVGLNNLTGNHYKSGMSRELKGTYLCPNTPPTFPPAS